MTENKTIEQIYEKAYTYERQIKEEKIKITVHR
jgi:hypothetical protein